MQGRALDFDVQLAIMKLRKEGLSQRIIAERLGLSRRTVQKYLFAREAAAEIEAATLEEGSDEVEQRREASAGGLF
jgi:predicted transcriptional regulator